jgi:hypothetical protein
VGLAKKYFLRNGCYKLCGQRINGKLGFEEKSYSQFFQLFLQFVFPVLIERRQTAKKN